jgi:hypothetical protein
MPLIQIGDTTHHHDQSITPVSLSTINVTSVMPEIGPGTPQLHHAALVGFSVRILGTSSD